MSVGPWINKGWMYVISETTISRDKGGRHMGKRKLCFIKNDTSRYYYYFMGHTKTFITSVIMGIAQENT